MLRHAFSQAPGTHSPHKPALGGWGGREPDTPNREQLPECVQKVTDGAQNPHNRSPFFSSSDRNTAGFAAVATKSTGRSCTWFSASLTERR